MQLIKSKQWRHIKSNGCTILKWFTHEKLIASMTMIIGRLVSIQLIYLSADRDSS